MLEHHTGEASDLAVPGHLLVSFTSSPDSKHSLYTCSPLTLLCSPDPLFYFVFNVFIGKSARHLEFHSWKSENTCKNLFAVFHLHHLKTVALVFEQVLGLDSCQHPWLLSCYAFCSNHQLTLWAPPWQCSQNPTTLHHFQQQRKLVPSYHPLIYPMEYPIWLYSSRYAISRRKF